MDDLLDRLRSPERQDAWECFLEVYSPLILEVIRFFERDPDGISDCYLFVCDQLSRDNFRRLRRFRPEGPARFTTWLCAVARNLCIDWHRQEVGRHRVFASIDRLSPLDQHVFQCVFVDSLPEEGAFLKMRHAFPALTIGQVRESIGRVQSALTPRQRWLLAVRRARATGASPAPFEQEGQMAPEAADAAPGPEEWTQLQEQRAALLAAMSKLTAQERLLVRMRFEYELTLDQIARVAHLDSAQCADRRIRRAVETLRMAMDEPKRRRNSR